ncbi:odorant receptor 63 [Apis mellifera]|nr:odorant receptor 63 [Apis mellifera]AHJ37469.1 olfactory receptor 63 [Apis mellifera]|eukprot:NP_001229913.1 odorant receptor 63 [Apis mellifera]
MLKKMKTTSNKDFAYAMTPLKFLAWPVGTWPLQVFNTFSIIRATFSTFLLLLMLTILQVELYLDSSNPEYNLDALILINAGILAVTKVICFHVRSLGLVSNFTSAVKDYKELNSEENRVIVRRHAYMGRAACISLIFCSYVGCTLFMIVPIVAGDKEEVINVTEESAMKYPVPFENTLILINMPENMYFLIFIVEYLMLLLTTTGNLGSDSLFFSIVFHLCGQVEILRLEYNKLSNENERTTKHITLLIKRHIYLLKLGDMLNKTISSILIVQLSSSCMLICTTGFEFILALSIGNIVMIVKTFAVICVLLIQLFAYSYVGEYLKTQTEGLGNSIYFCTWYDMPKNVSHNITFIIMRAQHPVLLTAGKFFVINMETYMSILRISMSYLSVLRVMVNS